jgi:mannose-6-phosphate isomerase-like protein (cupin superfamily)
MSTGDRFPETGQTYQHAYYDHNDPRYKIVPISAMKPAATPTFRVPEDHIKGWGKEVWLANTGRYCGKLLCFNKGARFSAHFHDLKDESFYILSGRIKFVWNKPDSAEQIEVIMEKGQVVDIPRLCVHQVEALEETVVVEVSSQHLETDSYRVRPGDSQKFVQNEEFYTNQDSSRYGISGVWRKVSVEERARYPDRQYYRADGTPILRNSQKTQSTGPQ